MYSNALIYTVQDGDTLSIIARLFIVPKDDIVKLNPQLKNTDQVTPGQRLLIPSNLPPPSMGSDSQALTYTVQEGDTLRAIARLFIVSEDDILKMNPQMKGKNQVTPGQELLIPPVRETN